LDYNASSVKQKLRPSVGSNHGPHGFSFNSSLTAVRNNHYATQTTADVSRLHYNIPNHNIYLRTVNPGRKETEEARMRAFGLEAGSGKRAAGIYDFDLHFG
jgi:hypothetical protein